jgi:sigma-B regulation protein RsbU (phosphoserine phosphatase)
MSTTASPPSSPSNAAEPPAGAPPSTSDLQHRLAIYEGLVRVSSLINSITDYEAMLEGVIEISRDVFRAEAASLFLPTSNGEKLLLRVAANENRLEKPFLEVPCGRGIAGWVWENQEAVLIPDAYEDERFFREGDRQTGFRTRSILCAPLVHEGKPVAVLQVLNARERDSFSAFDLEAINAYSSLLATALEKMRVLEARQKEELLHRDLSIASEIQRGLLERALAPSLRDGRFFAFNEPATDVGGDLFFATQNPRGDVWFAIGDVSGKGIAAALLMTQTMDALRFLLRGRQSPARTLGQLNQILQEITIRGMFVTILLGRYVARHQRMELATAGHCLPWILPRHGEPALWDLGSGLPLGIMPGVEYQQSSRTVHPEDLFLFFTDGLSESRPEGSKRQFEEELPRALKEFSSPANPDPSAALSPAPERLARHVLEAARLYRQGAPARDDLTILAYQPL